MGAREVPWTYPKVEMTLARASTDLLVPGWGENGDTGGVSGQGWAGECLVPCLL